MRTQEIHIKQRHIYAGEIQRSGHCPVALALREATGFEPSVGCKGLILYSDDARVVLNVPYSKCPDGEHVSEFIREFDCRRPVQPFSFQMPVPA